MQENYQYTVHFNQTEDGTIVATVPRLRGCISYGRTMEEAEQNIREAIECHREGLRDIGETIPTEEQTVSLAVVKTLRIQGVAV